MADQYYTLGAWHVRAGSEEEFLRTWRDELAAAFLRRVPGMQGTLIQSLDDPQQYYSFGPWESLEQMQAARADESVRQALSKLVALCDEAKPGPFRVVMTLP